ncbi:pyridoxal phosphate-dependent aminotransferase [Candidatus Eisenbacteria bacterium]|uniref:Aminotransferase n=1 Tax=Eiseniibacteriota bacterium TaxID=2212470 RepID=A0ABV6YLR4_UNCEI
MEVGGRVLGTTKPPLSPLMERVARRHAEGRDVFVLAQAMVDYPPPFAFMHALREALAADTATLHTYTPDAGTVELRTALSDHADRSFGFWTDPISQILVTPGANHAAYTALSVLLDPGDDVLLISPWYFNHEMTVRLLGGNVLTVIARPEDCFVPRVDELLAAWTPRLKALILVNPNNPTGARYPNEWIESFAAALTEDSRWQNVWILSDQTYQEIYFDNEPPLSPAALPELKDRTLTAGSFSKSLALAGWRLGFLTGPKAFISETLKVQDSSVICATHASQWALCKALEETAAIADYLQDKRGLLRRRRDALYAPLSTDKNLDVCLPGGACFFFVGLPEGIDGEVFAHHLLESYDVATVPGIHFGPEWKRFLRVSYGTESPERLEQAALRLCECLASWRDT